MFFGFCDYGLFFCFGVNFIDFLWFNIVVVKYEVWFEDGMVVGRFDGVEFIVKDG